MFPGIGFFNFFSILKQVLDAVLLISAGREECYPQREGFLQPEKNYFLHSGGHLK